MSDYSELKRVAEAATPGPWDVANKRYGGVIRGGPMQNFTNGRAQSQIVMCCGAEWMEPGQLEQNAEYIAAANPAVVLALIAEVEGLRAQHGRDSDELRSLCQSRDDARKDRDQLKAEVARSTEREIMQLAEIEALRKSVEFGADCFRKISSGDGSGHADLAESILRRAGSAMGKGEQP